MNSSQPPISSRLCRASAIVPPTKCRNRSTHRCWHLSHGILYDHCWLEKSFGRLSAGIMRDRMAATACGLNRSSMSSRAARLRGEGRSHEPPCLTALADGLTNDGGMTDYLLLLLRHQPGDDPLPTK